MVVVVHTCHTRNTVLLILLLNMVFFLFFFFQKSIRFAQVFRAGTITIYGPVITTHR